MVKFKEVLLLSIFTISGQAVDSSFSGVLSSGLSVCPSRTINYITDTLPQQCLNTATVNRTDPVRQILDKIGVDSNATLSPTSSARDVTTSASPTPQARLASLLPSIVQPIEETPRTSKNLTDTNLSSADVEDIVQVGSTAKIDEDVEGDSPLDNANFLSFEDWKKQNLAKAGQTVESIGGRIERGNIEPRRRPGGINNALDSLGEDSEIEIDFGGFVTSSSTAQATHSEEAVIDVETSDAKSKADKSKYEKKVSGSHPKRKDAGKTCKERFNYASFDCAATVLKTNKECRGATSVLVENKDSYMLNKCSANNKFFIVELCNDILVDTVVLANFEFFSSMFRTFRVSVSDRYPVKLDKWRELGTYEASNSREVQAFLVESPLIWARYLRIEFLAHFGNEYYCPISLLRIHGTTMMEEFNHDMKGLRDEEDAELESGEENDGGSVVLESDSEVVLAGAPKEKSRTPLMQANKTIVSLTTHAVPLGHQNASKLPYPSSTASTLTDPVLSGTRVTSHSPLLRAQSEASSLLFKDRNLVCMSIDQNLVFFAGSTPSDINSHTIIRPTMVSPLSEPAHPETSQTLQTPNPTSVNPTGPSSPVTSLATTIENLSDKGKAANPTMQINAKIPTSSTHPPAANPTTQESFFKTIHKRLSLLESNSTLSLQYIEEQSRILRDAFSKVEKRQLSKITTFLDSLNTTMLSEVRSFRSQYDQLWQSTVLELSAQRELSRHENVALSARLSLLADEAVFQKRMMIVQFVLILLCLGLVMFSRASSLSLLAPTALTSSNSELSSLMQTAFNKSSPNLTQYARSETPNTSPSSTRPSSRYGVLGRGQEIGRSPSAESGKDARGKSGGFARDGQSDARHRSLSTESSPPMRAFQCNGESGRDGAPSAGYGGAPGTLSPERRRPWD